MRFDAVAFDLDGTLYPNAGLYVHAFPYMIPKARLLAAFNMARRTMRATDTAGGLGPAPDDGASFRARECAITAARLGWPESKTAAAIDRHFYHGVEELFAKVLPFRGAREALDAISAGGLRLAVLSDLPPERKLELMGLSERFECALCSEGAGALKPARAPFDMLASRLGLPNERILYVGNSPRIDAAGAKAAGMSAAIVSRRHIRSADLSFYRWQDLVNFALA